jgi:transcriptional antiterminator
MKKNEIKLTAEQRKELERFCKTGVHSAKLIKRAEIILLLDTSANGKAVTFEEISRRLTVSVTTITIVKKDFFATENVKAFLQRKNRENRLLNPR